MVGHGGSSADSYLADPKSPIPSHCASIVVTSTLRVNPKLIFYSFWAAYLDICLDDLVSPKGRAEFLLPVLFHLMISHFIDA